jgi:hypothetical protein
MSPDEYFDTHIPHRVNLLITFRQRYSGRYPQIALSREAYRDLSRCAKDMSLIMVRFFCEEMGIYLPKGKNDVEESKSWSSRFGSSRLSKAVFKADPEKYEELCKVLRAANRAVAHIEDGNVDHSFKTDSDDEQIFRVIDWIEDLIKTHIYQAAGRDFGRSMSLPNNVMYHKSA